MLYKEIPFLRIIPPLCAGIVSGLWFYPGMNFFFPAMAVIILLFTCSLFFNNRLTNILYGISLTVALFITGLYLYTSEKRSLSVLDKEETIFRGRLADYPEEKENSVKMNFELEESYDAEGQSKTLKGSMVLYCRKNLAINNFLPGDIMIIRCIPLSIKSQGNPYEFDYGFYMENHNTRYYAFADSSDFLFHKTPATRSISARALIIRERIINMFRERGISDDRLALVAAITLGRKNMLDTDRKLSFMKAGVMHIMAVSGLHAVILSLFVFKILFFLKGRLRILRILITLVLLWSFAFVTGLTSSVLRASLMYSFLQAGYILKRPVNGLNSVLASAFVLIMIRASVVFDAGFLLSYSAVIFIISFYQDLYKKVSFRYRIADLIWQSAAVTIIAQVGTLPLTLLLFNRFPVWFILSNIVIVPVASLLIVTACLVPLTYPVPFLSGFFAGILNHLAGLTEMLTKKVSGLPFSSIENIGLTSVESILLALSLFLLLHYFLKRRTLKVIYPLTAILLFLTAGTVKNISLKRTGELIVYNDPGNTAFGIRTGRSLNVYSDTTLVCTEALKHSAALNLKLSHELINSGSFYVKAGTKNILVTGQIDSTIYNYLRPDILILKGKTFGGIKKERGKGPAALIFNDATYSGLKVRNLITSIKPDSVHFIKNDGAYVSRIYSAW